MNYSEQCRPNGLAAGPYPDSNSAPSHDDPRVVRALQEYRDTLRAGQKPDRQEFLARHPEVASELAECLDGLELIQGAAPQLQSAGERPSATTIVPEEISAGAVLGDYEILHEIGRGGMGVVYKAKQQSLKRIVALKMVLAGQYAPPLEVQRLHAEAEAVAHLDHPHIVPIYEVHEDQGRHYFSMKLIEGSNLAQHTACLRGDPRAAAEMLATAARAVHYAHQRGILHRDLKPANILLDTRGRPHITDFGLAKRIAAAESLGQSQTGAAAGTPSYMAPEQAAGKRGLSTAADVYSLGAILYELLTGQPPFQAETALATLRRVLEEEPMRPRLLQPGVDKDLETICLKCLEKEPSQRYGSAEALAEDLERWLASEPIQARSAKSWERVVKWARRQPAVASLLLVSGLALAALITGLVVGILVVSREERQKEEALADRAQVLTGLERALEQERQTAYFQTIALAAPEALANNVQRADQLLDNCVPKFRNWEWHYLKRLCHAELLTLNPRMEPVAVVFSPDGQRVAAAGGILGKPGQVIIWGVPTGHILLTFDAHADTITGLAFSPDGQCLATSSRDRTVKTWDARSGQEMQTLQGHGDSVSAVAFSSDGRRVASASADQTVKVWNATTGQELLTLRGHKGTVWSVAFNPNGRWLASASTDQTVRVWDVETGQQLFTLRGHKATVRSVTFSRDGQHLASASYDKTVRVWDASTGQEILLFRGHAKYPTGVAFSPDGQCLASSSIDQTAKLWDTATGEDVLTLRGHSGSVWAIAFSPDGYRIATAGADGMVKLWNATNLLIDPIQLGSVGPIHHIALSPNCDRCVFARGEGSIEVWDASNGRRVSMLAGLKFPADRLAISPNGRWIAALQYKSVALWNADNGQLARVLPGGYTERLSGLVFSHDGGQLATAGGGRGVLLWDTTTGRHLKTLLEHAPGVTDLQFSGDTNRLVAAMSDPQGGQEVKVWDTDSGREIFAATNMSGPVALSPDGMFVALVPTGAAANHPRVWELLSGQQAFALSGQRAHVKALAYSPDGQRLASADQDEKIKLWDASRGQEILALSVAGGPVTALAFSRDGMRLFSVSKDGRVWVWDAKPLQASAHIVE